MISVRSEFVRIASNYLRILATFLIGLLVVRVLLGFGEQTYSIFTLVTIGAGVGVMLKELLRIALVPGLTTAFSEGMESGQFAEIYATSFYVSAAVAAFGCVLMATLYVCLDYLEIQPSYLDAARVFVILRASQMVLSVSLAPLLNMLVVTQRQGQANALLVAERFSDLAGILAALLFAVRSDGAPLVWYGAAGLSSLAIVYLWAVVRILRLDPAFRPSLSRARWQSLHRIRASVGWTSAIVLSMNLYLRFDVFFVNLVFGAFGTMVFGIAVQLIGYMRQLTTGLVSGVDAVFARLLTSDGAKAELGKPDVMWISGALQGLMVFFSIGFLAVFAEDLVRVWLGSALPRPAESAPLAGSAALIMSIGMGARSLTEGWMAMMAGSGKIGAYAGWLLPGAALNPLLVYVAAFWIAPEAGVLSIAWVFAILQLIVHGIGITLIASRVLETSLGTLLAPYALPAVCACTTVAIALLGAEFLAFDTAFGRLGLGLLIFSCGGLATLGLLKPAWQRSRRNRQLAA